MESPKKQEPICGIIMPISSIDGCSEAHWKDVRSIIESVIISSGFKPQLVSDSNETSIIQGTIVKNLFQNDLVVCDVSAKNPNVMFELGIRLTFDKPTVIIKDDVTDYNFDTMPIEHIIYRRDLRHNAILEFKESLKKKLKATYENATHEGSSSTFLKHFSIQTPSKLDTLEVPKMDYIMNVLKEIQNDNSSLKKYLLNKLNFDIKKGNSYSVRDLLDSNLHPRERFVLKMISSKVLDFMVTNNVKEFILLQTEKYYKDLQKFIEESISYDITGVDKSTLMNLLDNYLNQNKY